MKSTFSRLAAAFLLAAAANLAFWAHANRPVDVGPDIPGGQLRSLSFAPFRDGQSPLLKRYPSAAQIAEDMALLRGKTRSVRTYTSREGMDVVPALARQYGLKVTMGAWLTAEHGENGRLGLEINRDEIAALIELANAYPDVIERVIVGNEVLLRRDLPPARLLEYVREVKAAIRQPVSYADVWAFHLKNPQVTAELDYVTIHLLPYWEDEPAHIDDVGAHLAHYHRVVRDAFPDKPVLIGEAGWPSMGRSRGPAAPGTVNAARFVRTLVQVAEANGFDYNIVEAFDQPWKASLEGTVGAKWGLWSAARQPAFALTGPVVEHPDWPLRFVLSLMVAAALVAPVARRLEGPWGMLVVGLAQALAVGLVQYAFAAHAGGISFWAKTNFGVVPDLLALAFGVLLAAFAAAVVERAVESFDGRTGTSGPVRYLGTMYRVLTAIAMILAVAIVADGRYRDIPLIHFAVPMIGLAGLAALRLLSGRDNLSSFAGWEMLRARPGGNGRLIAVLLVSLAVLNIGAEGFAIVGEDFAVMHPTFAERAPLVLRAMISNLSVLAWSAILLALAAPYAADIALMRRVRAAHG